MRAGVVVGTFSTTENAQHKTPSSQWPNVGNSGKPVNINAFIKTIQWMFLYVSKN